MSTRFFLGLDLGQCSDFTALAVLDRMETQGPWDPVGFGYRTQIKLVLRQLARFPLGTPYPFIADKVKEAVERLQQDGVVRLAVDATGVGRPVADLLRQKGLSAVLYPVTATGGQREHGHATGYTVPKRDLVMGIRVLLERRALHFAKAARDVKHLERELREMEGKAAGGGSGKPGHETFSGKHDDLVSALGLACWMAQKTYPRLVAHDGVAHDGGLVAQRQRRLL